MAAVAGHLPPGRGGGGLPPPLSAQDAPQVRLFRGRIGEGVTLGSLEMDPCLLSVGKRAVICGFSTILSHAVERGRISLAPVRIGRGCGVLTRATILPGATMEDGALLTANSLLPKGRTVGAGMVGGGVPVRV